MKTINLLAFAIIASLLMSSCSSGLTITKRRYNKGFYVHKSGNVKQETTDSKTKIAVKQKTEAPVLASQNVEALPVAAPESAQKNTQGPVASAATKKSGKKAMAIVHALASAPVAARLIPEKKIRALRDADLLKRDPAGEALSLIWILIVVIAIIYIVGLLMDGFGTGGLIHILGVVILILLILWLLRII